VESERQALLAAARDYALRLEELATLKAGFMAMVAHELATPVAAIRGLADLLLAGHLAPTQHSSLIEAIRAEADLLRNLVADVQAAAAVERDEFEIRPRPVAVAALLAEAAAFARSLAGGHPLTEAIEDEAATSTVLADPGRIGQVLRNLLTNATKHTPAGTPIEMRARCVGAAVRIEVTDRGPGIHPVELERVFEKFGRGRDAEGRKAPGVGLGLYLSRRIVRAHGRELTVSSVPGEGTVFAFELEAVR
jgi:signal transduction histidine kinase